MSAHTTTWQRSRSRMEPREGASVRPERPDGRVRPGDLLVGVPVEVRNRFDDRWSHGFSIAAVGDDAYQLRRLSDGSILPVWFPGAMVRLDPEG